MKVSVILPTFNEKNNILPLVKDIEKYLNDLSDYEIIIIDDNSPDKTYDECLNNLNLELCKIFKRERDRGLAKSIAFGIKKSMGEKIVIMDTDHTHDPKYLNELLGLCEKYDLVIGSRFEKGGKMLATFHHYLSFLFNIFLRVLLRTGVKDNLGGYFCVKKSAINNLNFDKIFYGYGEYFFRLIFYLNKKKIKIKEIGVIYNLRYKDTSKSNFLNLFFQYLFEAIKLRLSSILQR